MAECAGSGARFGAQVPLAGRTAAQWSAGAGTQGENSSWRFVFSAGGAGCVHTLWISDAPRVLPFDARRSERHSRWAERTRGKRRGNYRLPARAVFRAGADYAPAHDLPVVEGDVPGGIFLRPATAYAGGFAGLGGRSFGTRQDRCEARRQ